MMNTICFRYAAITSLIVIMLALPRWTQHRLELESNKTVGRFNAAQILDRSQVIYCALAPDLEPSYLSASPICSFAPNGHSPHWKWQVTCTDSRGNTKTFIQWNAENGLLETVSQEHPKWTRAADIVTKTEALRIARSYMVTLSLQGFAETGNPDPPKLAEGVWTFEFRFMRSASIMQVSATTGRLVFSHTLTSASGARAVLQGSPHRSRWL